MYIFTDVCLRAILAHYDRKGNSNKKWRSNGLTDTLHIFNSIIGNEKCHIRYSNVVESDLFILKT